ncbi:ubiquitin-like protein modifier Ned8 [Ramicandelaber brevisporus]|nr:ubiquitin-like protein modifier Ned8 [Ramicandelaber brevisporus]
MQIKVKTLTGVEIVIPVDENDMISQLKEAIEAREGIPPPQQRLIFQGKQLIDNQHIKDTDLTNDCVIHLVLSLRGGSC